MSEDPTISMPQPNMPRRLSADDDQETLFGDQETAPTLPMGGRPAPGPGPAPRSTSDPPFAPMPGGFGPLQPAPAQDETMLVRDRPAPVFAWLVVVDGPDRAAVGTVHTLRPGTTTIGRSAANHVVLRDDAASSQHARIRIEGQESETPAYILYDMGSSNGTYVGSRGTYRFDESRTYRRTLDDGDYLLLGETTLAFKKL